jgi:hypothetical protein
MGFNNGSVSLSEVVDPRAFILESIRIFMDPLGEGLDENLGIKI